MISAAIMVVAVLLCAAGFEALAEAWRELRRTLRE